MWAAHLPGMQMLVDPAGLQASLHETPQAQQLGIRITRGADVSGVTTSPQEIGEDSVES